METWQGMTPAELSNPCGDDEPARRRTLTWQEVRWCLRAEHNLLFGGPVLVISAAWHRWRRRHA